MKKKIIGIVIIVLVIIIVGFAIVLTSAVISHLKQEILLKIEVKRTFEMIDSENLEKEQIEKRLNRTVTQKEYIEVEKAIKEYLRDIYENDKQLRGILEQDTIGYLLTTENYKEDGPEFVKTKEYIRETKETLKNCKKQYEQSEAEEKIDSYLKNKNLEDYDIEFYKNELIILVKRGKDNQDIIKSIEEIFHLLELQEDVIEFLISNKQLWTIEKENIVFSKEELANQYDTLTSLLTNLPTNQKEDEKLYEKEFGSYYVVDSWIESEKHSTKNKFFYVKEGTEEKQFPNNISINMGKNRYSSAEHEKFKNAILNQLYRQVAGEKGINIKATGGKTINNSIMYTFIIEEPNNVTTTQYYIVGEYQYILIQETTYEKSEETDNVAKEMVDTFQWGKE